jgi:F-type H+-transporting ATPase subunit a
LGSVAAEAHSPLEQFKIERLFELHIGGVDASFTNSALFMLIAILAITAFLLAGDAPAVIADAPAIDGGTFL